MTPAEFHDWTAGVQSVATALSITVGGLWVYMRFVRQQDNYPHIESAADLQIIGQQGDAWIVEIVAILENKGRVAHHFRNISFDLNAIFRDEEVGTSEKWGGQVDFPHSIARGSFKPGLYTEFFIGPSVKARYSWIARVPSEASVLNLHCGFEYMNRKSAVHSMETSLSLPFDYTWRTGATP